MYGHKGFLYGFCYGVMYGHTAGARLYMLSALGHTRGALGCRPEPTACKTTHFGRCDYGVYTGLAVVVDGADFARRDQYQVAHFQFHDFGTS
jgi:hypothetical protein